MIRVSVIVPIFNVSKYLPRFFISLKKQKLSDVEYILVDDGSTDDSLQLCYKFKENMEHVAVIHQSNMGVGAARNKGLKIAKGKYIYFCDPDDTLESNLLIDNYFLAEKYNADLVIFGFKIEDISGKLLKTFKFDYKFYPYKSDFIKIFPMLCHDFLLNYLWNKFYRREVIQHLNFENVRTGEDLRFNILVYNVISKVIFNDQIYYHYLQGRPNSSQVKKSINDIYLYLQEDKELKDLFFNHWNKKSDPRFVEIIQKLYRNVGMELVLRAESHSDHIERKEILKIISDYDIDKYFTFNLKKGIKFNYDTLIFKLRNIPIILLGDKLLRRLKK